MFACMCIPHPLYLGRAAQARAAACQCSHARGLHSALTLAASAGMIDACRLLLREGATVDAADNSGVTRSLHSCMHACTGTLRLSTCSVITCNYMKQFRLIEKHR
jgi:hypothetical protein